MMDLLFCMIVAMAVGLGFLSLARKREEVRFQASRLAASSDDSPREIAESMFPDDAGVAKVVELAALEARLLRRGVDMSEISRRVKRSERDIREDAVIWGLAPRGVRTRKLSRKWREGMIATCVVFLSLVIASWLWFLIEGWLGGFVGR